MRLYWTYVGNPGLSAVSKVGVGAGTPFSSSLSGSKELGSWWAKARLSYGFDLHRSRDCFRGVIGMMYYKAVIKECDVKECVEWLRENDGREYNTMSGRVVHEAEDKS